MTNDYQALTEKEKQTLRLLLAGHDAKSLARSLGLSVHTVNERLRDARRKLSASSSREAARLLFEVEGGGDKSLRDDEMRGATVATRMHKAGPSHEPSPREYRARWIIGGLAMMSLAIALLALSPTTEVAGSSATQPAAAPASPGVVESSAVQSARQWLALVDAAKWNESFEATTQSFRSLNTVDAWRAASLSGRVPLGAVLSRTLSDELAVPAAPSGNHVVRFQTRFANKPGATETVSLSREDGIWKVVGYYID